MVFIRNKRNRKQRSKRSSEMRNKYSETQIKNLEWELKTVV